MSYQAYPDAKPTPTYSAAGLPDIEYIALRARHLTQDTCRRFAYGVDAKGNQRATYFDSEGRPVASKARTPDKRFWVDGDASQMGLFGAHLWKPGRRLIITEGELDAMSVSQVNGHKYAVVSVPQGAASAVKAIGAALEWVEGFEDVVLMFDSDEPGQAAAVACAQLLSPGKARIAKLPLKDASELLMANRGSDITKAMWNASPWAPTDLVWGDEVWERLDKYETPPGVPYPLPGLNALVGGLRFGELVTVCAGTGVGKSTFMREMAASMAETTKVAYIALEETLERAALGMLSVKLNKPLHLGGADDATKALMKAAWDELASNLILFDGWGSLGVDELMAKVRYLTKACDCRVVFLDHLSLVISGLDTDNERKAIDMVMTKLATLAVETGAAIVIVSHLNSPNSTARTHEEGGRVRLTNLRGSRSIGQLSHDVFALERDQQSEDASVASLRVLKSRFTGRTGIAAYLSYDENTGRLTECPDPGSTNNTDFS